MEYKTKVSTYRSLNTLSDDDLQAIRLLDTGRNVTGWQSDALKYNPENT